MKTLEDQIIKLYNGESCSGVVFGSNLDQYACELWRSGYVDLIPISKRIITKNYYEFTCDYMVELTEYGREYAILLEEL